MIRHMIGTLFAALQLYLIPGRWRSWRNTREQCRVLKAETARLRAKNEADERFIDVIREGYEIGHDYDD